MTWIARSLPPEPDLPPPDPPPRIELLAAERNRLIEQLRPRIRSNRQERIRRRIAEITLQILANKVRE